VLNTSESFFEGEFLVLLAEMYFGIILYLFKELVLEIRIIEILVVSLLVFGVGLYYLV